MMSSRTRKTIALAAVLCCAGVCRGTEPTEAPATNAVESVPQPAPPVAGALSTDVEALIQILQTKYVNPSQVADTEMTKAAVQGIVQALGHGAELAPTGPPAEAPTNQPPAVRAETVAPLIGYVGLRRLNADSVKELDAALTKFDGEKIDSLVLDLRFTTGGTFDDATELAGKFLLKDKMLFSVQSPQAALAGSYATTQPSAFIDWKLAVVVNGETQGPAEAAAAALREHGRALVVGTPSAGKAVLWSDETLPSGLKVRIATGKAVTGRGTELFPNGPTPDVPLPANLDLERKVLFELSDGRKLREFVEEEPVEKRINEAALVRMLRRGGTNAPAEAIEEPKPDDTAKKAPPTIDIALQRAVDILKGIRILHLD